MNSVIKETQNYILTVGASKPTGVLAYQVINKEYKVVEIETFLLPQALRHMEDLQAALDAQIDSSTT